MKTSKEMLEDYEFKFPQLEQDIYLSIRSCKPGDQDAANVVGKIDKAFELLMGGYLSLKESGYKEDEIKTKRSQIVGKICEFYINQVRLTPPKISYDQASVADVMENQYPDQFFGESRSPKI